MSPPIRIGILGFGKIARDQHLPALAGNPEFELAAVASLQAVQGIGCLLLARWRQ